VNQYLVEYRTSAVEDADASARLISAHRVESWSNDYAFFGHPRSLGLLTHLIPRDLVRAVELTYCDGDGGKNLSEVKDEWSPERHEGSVAVGEDLADVRKEGGPKS